MTSGIIRESLEQGESYLDGLRESRVSGSPTPEEIRSHLGARYPFTEPVGAKRLVSDVGAMLERWAVHTVHPRYFGYFNPTPLPEAIAADVLAACYNPQLAVWSHGPAAVEIEQHVLRWMAGRLGLPEGRTAAHFTSGGSEANLTATIAALTAKLPGYGVSGVSGQNDEPVVYHSAAAHDSFTKICHMTGIGRRALHVVPVDGSLRLDVGALRERIVADRGDGCRPVMVVATAGTTAAGVIDPLDEVAAVCREHDLWFHIDAAWGGAALLSPVLRRHFAGIEAADSITCDAHKWLSVTMGAGMFFSRHPRILEEAFRVTTDYMPDPDAGSVDPFTTSAQWSRRFIGLRLFMALAALGESGYAEMIDHQAEMGRYMRRRLTEEGWIHRSETPLPVCCVSHPAIDGAPDAVDRVLRDVLERGRVWISKVELGEYQALRACVTSRLTREDDVDVLVEELNDAVAGLGT